MQEIQKGIDAKTYLRSSDVRAQVVNHVVYIQGKVDTYLESAVAEGIAQRVAGDARIVNLIYVSNQGG